MTKQKGSHASFDQYLPLLTEIPAPLLYWYRANARTLPWRSDPTPYHVWISEIMLQQTRVEAVKPYYLRFLEVFPDIPSLAHADDEMLHKLWEGLGYYSRANNLKKCALVLTEQFAGQMPPDAQTLETLPGIGPYTAGAISSIAYGRPAPAVDGNVLRVITRLCCDASDIGLQETKTAITHVLRLIYPPADCAAFTQGLMELGATVCIPNGKPDCTHCPLSHVCHGKIQWEQIPHKAPKKPRKIISRSVFLLRCGNEFALQKRAETGLLAGLWEYPAADDETATAASLKAAYGKNARLIGTAKHIFTHLEWHMKGYLVVVDTKPTGYAWATPDEINARYTIPSAYRFFTDRTKQLVSSADKEQKNCLSPLKKQRKK